ncbi:MAG: hypothetical protein ABJE66_24920 [Deltaproteobacteria bacterium]
MWRRVRYVLLLLALCAIATCPTAKRSCNAKIRAREAEHLIDVIADKVEQHVAVTGRVPTTAAAKSPAVPCCEQGGLCKPDLDTWAAPGWKELEFSIDDPYRYQYEYAPDPSGQSAIVRAVGNLDCDQEPSLYELQLTVKGTSLERTWTHRDP